MMALPKKKKRLGELQTNHQPITELPADLKKVKAGSDTPASDGSPDNARHEQMEKAFKMVDSIEHVHSLAPISVPVVPANRTMQRHDASDPTAIHLKLSLGTPPVDTGQGDHKNVESKIPVVDVQVRIPSFIWKLPIIGVMARNIIKKFIKG
jgi:hypothetical protein